MTKQNQDKKIWGRSYGYPKANSQHKSKDGESLPTISSTVAVTSDCADTHSHTGKPKETSNPSIASSNVGVLDRGERTPQNYKQKLQDEIEELKEMEVCCQSCGLGILDLKQRELKGYEQCEQDIFKFIEEERDKGNVESGGFSAGLFLSDLIKRLKGNKK